jgi:hypothetical protein
MVVNDPQDMLAEYLCSAVHYTPTKHFYCLGRWSLTKNKLVGVVGFDHWGLTSVEMHVAGEPGFVSKELLYKTFALPFIVQDLDVVLGRVDSNNKAALRFNKHLGFQEMCRIPNAARSGDLVVMAMQKTECRWLKIKGIPLMKVA